FQAEDGIRDFHVTGVQTCALPISLRRYTLHVTRYTLHITHHTSHITPYYVPCPRMLDSIRAAPFERDELAGLAGAIPLEAERVRAIGRRAAPSCDPARTCFRARQVVYFRDLAFARGAHQRFGCREDVVRGNLGFPRRKIRSDLHLDGRESEPFVLALHQFAEALRPATPLAAKTGLQGSTLRFVRALV